MKVARCNAEGCQARILWARTIKGSLAPIDVEPVDDGNIVLLKRVEDGEPFALVVTGSRFLESEQDVMRQQGVAFYVDHHSTCPNADDFRNTPL